MKELSALEETLPLQLIIQLLTDILGPFKLPVRKARRIYLISRMTGILFLASLSGLCFGELQVIQIERLEVEINILPRPGIRGVAGQLRLGYTVAVQPCKGV